MTAQLILVRHGESVSNVSRLWQGRGDAELTPNGETQVAAVSPRLKEIGPDLVITSPFQRARATAEALGSAETDDRFIEIDVGQWEGLKFDEVVKDHEGDLVRALSDPDHPFGGDGETINDVIARVTDGISDLAERVGSGGTAVVFTHGGVVDSMLRHLVPSARRLFGIPDNTSLTHLWVGEEWMGLQRFNDVGHLGLHPGEVEHALKEGWPVLALIRHGQTRANVEGRWQGQICWGLDEIGEDQAESLAGFYASSFDAVYTSPLDRAASTADRLSTDPVLMDGLMEMNMGEWEGFTTAEIQERDPRLFSEIFEKGRDLPRGRTGETWKRLGERVRSNVEAIDAKRGSITAVVMHGAAIRSYITAIAESGEEFAHPRMASPENTSISHVVLDDEGPRLASYGMAPHLDVMLSGGLSR